LLGDRNQFLQCDIILCPAVSLLGNSLMHKAITVRLHGCLNEKLIDGKLTVTA
jgi:hypothetical protein